MGRRWDAEVRRSRREPNAFARDLFDGLPARYDVLEELLSFGQNRRWRRAMVDAVADGRPRTVLDVATGTAGVALMLAGSDRRRHHGCGPHRADAAPRPRQRVVAAGERRVRLAVAPGRAAAVPRRDLRRADLHLPPALRRRPGRGPARARPGGPPGGAVASLEFVVPPAPGVAAGVAAVHPRGPARRRIPDGRARVGARRPVPRAVDRGPLPPLPGRAARRDVAGGGVRSTCGRGR